MDLSYKNWHARSLFCGTASGRCRGKLAGGSLPNAGMLPGIFRRIAGQLKMGRQVSDHAALLLLSLPTILPIINETFITRIIRPENFA